MKYSLFLGCTIPVRARNYEMATRKIAGILGIEFVHLNDFNCCGFPVRSTQYLFAETLAARNLAVSEAENLDICVLCSACSAVLAETNHELISDPDRLRKINSHLKLLGREYRGTVKIRHFTRVLFEDIGINAIRSFFKFDLSSLIVAPHYGCHYLKPSIAHGEFDDSEYPASLSNLISGTGAQNLTLENRKHCCGGAVLAVNSEITYQLASKKLDQATQSHADCMCVICPFCAVIYDDNQKSIEQHVKKTFDLPVLYLPQLIGLAMGLEPKELGLNLNKVKTSRLLEKLESSIHHEQH